MSGAKDNLGRRRRVGTVRLLEDYLTQCGRNRLNRHSNRLETLELF